MRWMVIACLAGACGDNLPVIDAAVLVDAALAPRLRVSPTMSDFAPTEARRTSAPFAFVVTNEGTAASGLIEKHIDGADALSFMISSDSCTASLRPQASCTIELTFMSPYGSRAARLVMSAVPGGELAATLEGTAVPHDYLTVSPVVHDYGDVMIGQSFVQAFVISNAGGSPAGALSTPIAGTDPTQFALSGTDTCTGMTLAPGGACTLTVAFSPTTGGMKTAVIVVTQPLGPQVQISVAGNATP